MPSKLPEETFRKQCRFNNGYHDAQLAASLGWPRRERIRQVGRFAALPAGKDWKAYRDGYEAGWLDWYETKVRNESSQAAWERYCGAAPALS